MEFFRGLLRIKIEKKSLAARCPMSFLFSTFFLITSISLPQRVAFADTCAKADVTSGETCQEVKVKFDLTNCPDSKTAGEVRVSCSNDHGTASVFTKEFTYTLKLHRITASLGDVLWDAEGTINQRAIGQIEPTPETKPKKKVQRTSIGTPVAKSSPQTIGRSPAAVSNMYEAKQNNTAQAAASPVPFTINAPPTPSPSPTRTISFSGLFDGYYGYNFNHPVPVNAMTNGGQLPPSQNLNRNYDLYSNQFALNLAELEIKATSGEVSLLTDLDFGQAADNVSQYKGVTDSVAKNIGQAFVTYTPAALPNLSVNFGKMYSNMGYETFKSSQNWQYSRSFIYTLGTPAWALGASAIYSFVPGKFSAGLYVNDGWNTIYSVNSSKTFGGQLNFTPWDGVSFVYNLTTGPDQPDDNSTQKTVHELIATWNASAKVSFASDFIYGRANNELLPSGSIGNATWVAESLAAKYAPLSWYYFSPRFEVYRDAQGYTSGAEQTLSALTLTNSFALGSGLETRIELRLDHSTASTFINNDNASTPNQGTFALAVLYGF